MRYTYLILVVFLFEGNLSCQKHDYTWLWGYDASDNVSDTSYGTTVMDFNTNSLFPKIYYDGYKLMDFTYSSGINCISDYKGKYMFAFNGKEFENYSNEKIKNSNPLYIYSTDEIPAFGICSGLVLPHFTIENRYFIYFIIHKIIRSANPFGAGFKIIQSEIDMNLHSGKGEMINKYQLIYQDTLEYSTPVATKHANGRDWWIIMSKRNSNVYHTFLLSPYGVSLHHTQQIGEPIITDWGQNAFSPDGNYYAKNSESEIKDSSYFLLFNFDRCTGHLSNSHSFKFKTNSQASGISFSPNSKYLYIAHLFDLFQVDLSDNQYQLESVVVYDNFIGDIDRGFPYKNAFGFMQIAPDGRIYNSPIFAGATYLNVIEYPDKKGFQCNVKQHGLRLPAPQRTMPVNPNYRLGPIDGSICDSLMINNYPVAEFRYNQDTTNPLKIEFTDLSYYEPTEWFWDFGNPGSPLPTSKDTSPIHTFSATGIFKVCLTVKNSNGQNTNCKDLHLGSVATKESNNDNSFVSIYPNPVKDRFNLMINDYLPSDARLIISDDVGKEMFKSKIYHGWNNINIHNLPNGIYYYNCYDKNIEIGKGKLVKMN